MYAKSITYNDFDGNERTETFYFNLTEAEVARLEIGEKGGLSNMVKKIMQEKDTQKIWDVFEKIVVMSCGMKSADGRRFDKSPEAKAEFTETNAYSDFIMDLCTDADLASEFVQGLMSSVNNGKMVQVQQKIEERKALEANNRSAAVVADIKPVTPAE